jgi:hypothetical protein
MTNKLGSANPNRIPKSKLKVSPDFDFKKVLEESLDEGYNHRISKLMKIKQDMITLREMSYKYLERDDLSDEERKKIKKSMEGIDDIEEKAKLVEQQEEEYIKGLLKHTSGTDKYGVPNAISFEDYEKNFSKRDINLFRDVCRDFIKQDKGFDWSQFTDQDIENSLDYVMEYMPHILQLVGEHEGQGYQHIIKPLQILFTNATLRAKSKKTNQIYLNATHKKIVDKLKFYWDDNLPLGDNKKSYFNKIADEYEIKGGYDTIKKMEERFRKHYAPNFVPSRK